MLMLNALGSLLKWLGPRSLRPAGFEREKLADCSFVARPLSALATSPCKLTAKLTDGGRA